MSRQIAPLAVLLLAPSVAGAQSLLVPHGSQNGGSHLAAFDPFDGSLQTSSFIDLDEDGAPNLRSIQAAFTRGEWWVTDNALETVRAWSRFGANYLREELGFNGDLEGATSAFGSTWICAQEAPFAPGTILEIGPASVTEHRVYLDAPAGICEFQGELIVTGGNDVFRFDPNSGTVISTIFTSASQQGFTQPLPRASTGRLLIARAAGFSDIVEMDLSGTIVNEFDVGATLGLFAPRGCYELGNGNFLVSWSGGVSVTDPGMTFVEHVLENVNAQHITPTVDVTLGQNYCGPAVPNSTGRSAHIAATGATLASVGELRLTANDLPNQSSGYFITSQTQGFIANPGGSMGNVCVAGSIGRFLQQVQNTSTVRYLTITVDTQSIPQPNGTAAILAGQTWNFQAWYRDSVGGQATSNFTDAVSVPFV